MKKVLALLLAVLMLASVGCVWAEEGEINFGELAWGSTAEELNGILHEREDRYQRWTTRFIVEENALMEPATAFIYMGEHTPYVFMASIDDVELAERTSENACLYFAYTSENGAVQRDDSHAQLYGVRCEFTGIPVVGAPDDGTWEALEVYFTGLYGEPKMKTDNVVDFFGEYEENGMISSSINESCVGDDSSYIVWQSTSGDSMIVMELRETKRQGGITSRIWVNWLWLGGDVIIQNSMSVEVQ